jgi:hypothetical protein
VNAAEVVIGEVKGERRDEDKGERESQFRLRLHLLSSLLRRPPVD